MNAPAHVDHLRPHGYSPIYHPGEVNRCPGCLRSQWLVGRSTAECAFCGTALPLEHTGLEGISLGAAYWDRDILRHGWHFGPARDLHSEHSLEPD